MPALLNHIDPNGLEEFSVVFTDRSLNHMSKEFQKVMCDLSSNLKEVYNASAVVLVPAPKRLHSRCRPLSNLMINHTSLSEILYSYGSMNDP